MTTKKMTTVGILCGMALVLALTLYIPIVPAVSFLKYEPKDVVMVVGGFIYGPMTVVLMSVIVSILEIFFRAGNLLDVIMNVISTVAFAGTAALNYQKKRTKNVEYRVCYGNSEVRCRCIENRGLQYCRKNTKHRKPYCRSDNVE